MATALVMIPLSALAQEQLEGCTLRHDISWEGKNISKDATVKSPTYDEWGVICLLDAIYTVTDWIFLGLIAITGGFIIWGGITIATAAGSSDKINQGRNYIVWAMAGLAVALLSKAIPGIVTGLIGG